MTRRLLLSFTLLALTVAPSLAQQPSTESREYDLHVLLVQPPDFDPADKDKPQTQASRQQQIDNIFAWLRSTVQSNESDIDVSHRADAEGTFVVRATQAQHDRIVQLIDKCMAAAKTNITTETRFVFLARDDEATLTPELQQKLALSRHPGARRGGIQLERDEADAISHIAAASKSGSTITAPRVTIFNRQRAYVMVRSEHDFVSGYDRSKDNAWVQKKDKFQTGIFVDISGATDDRQEIAVKLIADYDRLIEMKDAPFKDAPGENLNVQIPLLDTRKLDTLFSVHSGETMLFSLPPQAPVEAPTQLYILIRATAIGG